VNAHNQIESGPTVTLSFQEVCHSYGAGRRSLDGLNLELGRNETLCLLGESGSGKTTALRLVNRLERASSGKVLLRGRDVLDWDPIELRRSMGYVIQSGGLFPHLSVARNISLICELEGWEAERIRSRVEGLMQDMELDPLEFGERFPSQLSGGQRQRVGVARALALDPDLLLMDEPFGALDPLTRRRLQRSFLNWQTSQRRSVILVTHDLDEAFLLGDRIAILRAGKLEQVDTPKKLLAAPASEYVRSLLAEFEHA
jgi:osmoprotectant transport system ATP-binding protein